MRSNDRIVAITLVIVGLSLCGGNLWFTASRTTIPLSLNLQVVKKELRHEKHPGLDDVHLIHTSTGTAMVVDGSIFSKINDRETITKDPWSRQLSIGSQCVELIWSADVLGMMWAMPIAATVLGIVGAVSMRQKLEEV